MDCVAHRSCLMPVLEEEAAQAAAQLIRQALLRHPETEHGPGENEASPLASFGRKLGLPIMLLAHKGENENQYMPIGTWPHGPINSISTGMATSAHKCALGVLCRELRPG